MWLSSWGFRKLSMTYVLEAPPFMVIVTDLPDFLTFLTMPMKEGVISVESEGLPPGSSVRREHIFTFIFSNIFDVSFICILVRLIPPPEENHSFLARMSSKGRSADIFSNTSPDKYEMFANCYRKQLNSSYMKIVSWRDSASRTFCAELMFKLLEIRGMKVDDDERVIRLRRCMEKMSAAHISIINMYERRLAKYRKLANKKNEQRNVSKYVSTIRSQRKFLCENPGMLEDLHHATIDNMAGCAPITDDMKCALILGEMKEIPPYPFVEFKN